MADKIWMHVDMDSYFASCEQQANPFLRGKPVAVCGDPQGGAPQKGSIDIYSRSVIAAASQEAKKFGVNSGMPLFQGKKLCPELVFVRADKDKYHYITRRFLKMLTGLSPSVYLYSIDEAFVDLSYFNRFQKARNVARRLKAQVKKRLGPEITCSCGLAPNCFLAKLASDREKPDGLFVAKEEDKKNVVENLSLAELWGIGPKTEEKLKKMGISSVRQLSKIPVSNLHAEFGLRGYYLKRMAQGGPVPGLDSPGKLGKRWGKKRKDDLPCSCSRSKTLTSDIQSRQRLKRVAAQLIETLTFRLREKNLAAWVVGIELKFNDFSAFSRQRKLGAGIKDEAEILRQLACLLSKEKIKKPVRKIKIRLGALRKDSQPSLLSSDKRRREILQVKDDINKSFGPKTVFSLRAVEN